MTPLPTINPASGAWTDQMTDCPLCKRDGSDGMLCFNCATERFGDEGTVLFVAPCWSGPLDDPDDDDEDDLDADAFAEILALAHRVGL